ncbi:MAG TPA: hypothetical protein VFZ66_28185 [Herpetosiphonaceae bacterium]
MWHWNNDWLVQERQRDLLHEAERQHVLRIVLAQRQPTPRSYGPVLVWFGRRLSTWGARIQARYTPLEWCGDAYDAGIGVPRGR